MKLPDQLAIKNLNIYPFIGLAPACSILERAAKWFIREWMNRRHQELWKCTPEQKHAKSFLQEPSAKKTRKLLQLNRNQLRHVTALLTEHCHLKGHLFKLGPVNSPTCERCHNKEETASHVLCDCEASAELRFCHERSHFVKPSAGNKTLIS
jgi:hypothetical protein